MTTDEAIKHGREQLEIFGGEHREFIECSLDIMRKYRLIEHIVKIAHTGTSESSQASMAVIEKIMDGEYSRKAESEAYSGNDDNKD